MKDLENELTGNAQEIKKDSKEKPKKDTDTDKKEKITKENDKKEKQSKDKSKDKNEKSKNNASETTLDAPISLNPEHGNYMILVSHCLLYNY